MSIKRLSGQGILNAYPETYEEYVDKVIVGKNSTVIDQKIGDCIQMSQSGSLAGHRVKHGVKKITKGTRYALVFWNFA